MSTSDQPLQSTVLLNEHIALGARMVPFAGWNMPVQYSEGIIAEHKHTREQVSLFDICHMGEFRVKGANAASALDKIAARPVAEQKNGVCRYNFILNKDGGVLDDIIIYRLADDEFYIVVNAGTRPNDAAHFRKLLPADVSFADESDATAKLDLQGPLAADVLESCGLEKAKLPAYFNCMKSKIGGVDCILSRTGYTGELGFEIYIPADKAVEIWRLLLSKSPVKPAGLGARDTLRLEMGYPLYGHELNTETSPVEAGFGAMLKLESPRTFEGSDALKAKAPLKKLIGIELEGRRAAREGSPVLFNGKLAGKVSSGAFSPSLGKAVAMAYIDSAFDVKNGDELALDAGKATIPGKATELPFYKNGTVRKKL